MLAGTASVILPGKMRLQLERATEAFYQKNYAKLLPFLSIKVAMQLSTEKHSTSMVKWNLNNLTPSTARDLKSKILSNPINPNNQDFRAYAYLLDEWNSTPRIGSWLTW